MSKFRIGRTKYTFALTHGASATTVTLTGKQLNGILRQVIIKTPAVVDGSATATFNLIDSDSNTVYTKAGVAVNTVSNNLLTQDLSVPLGDAFSMSIVYSAAQTATDTTSTVVLVVDKG